MSFPHYTADCAEHHHVVRDYGNSPRLANPTITVLCGSTRFGDVFREQNLHLTLAGHIVLTIGCDMRSDTDLFAGLPADAVADIKTRLDELHKRKIDLADEVLVLNCLVDGIPYIGDSTRSEIEYAKKLGRPVRHLVPIEPVVTETTTATAETRIDATTSTVESVEGVATAEPFDSFAIVEMLGHRRVAGRVREVQVAGAGFLRLDIPATDGHSPQTQYIAPGSIYALHPTTEELATAAAARCRPEPIARWELAQIGPRDVSPADPDPYDDRPF